MCPVGVVGNPVLRNIALFKAAVQSGGGDSADNAVDGHFDNNLCTTTSRMTNPWWSVDLKKQTIVTHVTVTSCGKDSVPTTIWSQLWKQILRQVSCCSNFFFWFSRCIFKMDHTPFRKTAVTIRHRLIIN